MSAATLTRPAPASGVSTRAVWQQRCARYWATHPHRCHACGRPVNPTRQAGGLRGEVHHLTYRYPTGQEPDEILVGLCHVCHDEWTGHSLHATQRAWSRRRGWMHGATVTNPARHYRSLWRWSVWWIRRRRLAGWMTWGADLPAWSAPDRSWR